MLKPLGDRVVLKLLPEEETTKSGLVLPTNTKEKSQVAEIIAVGPGGKVNGKDIEMIVEVGQKVVCTQYSGTEIKYNNETYTIVKQDDILAILE